MRPILITGVGGLVGAACARHFARTRPVVGIDNDMRRTFFGQGASSAWQVDQLIQTLGPQFSCRDLDIRDQPALSALFKLHNFAAVIHCAAQPSHDWAALNPTTDFAVNATGTLTLLECARARAIDCVFVHLSTNKVYGDRPNELPLVELETRFDLAPDHPHFAGIDETMPVDQCLHSLFGVSKLAADLLVQEYGRYFGLPTVCLRGGCLTGPGHSGAELHGFLSYLMKCTLDGTPYRVLGHGGKQLRDNLHCADLATLIGRIVEAPPIPGSVFNVGGGRVSAVSVQEAIELAQTITGKTLRVSHKTLPRIGDHQWYITDNSRVQDQYPGWQPSRTAADILASIARELGERRA